MIDGNISFSLISELIDTCWNVNLVNFNQLVDLGTELIDTCWNVNESAIITSRFIAGINRYMLECKCKRSNRSC